MAEKEAVLVSACLLGVNCRYNGEPKADQRVLALLEKGVRLVPVCPEQLGGLPTPRPPAEIRADGRVLTREGTDVTGEYRRGAGEALHLARLYRCRLAVFKARSPSCGKGQVYDGTFSGHPVPGDGVTARLLLENGLRVLTEEEIGPGFPGEAPEKEKTE